MTRAYETDASRKAVHGIAAILAQLPLSIRADVVEEAYGAGLPIAWADTFKARFGADPVPVLLVGGEIASDITLPTRVLLHGQEVDFDGAAVLMDADLRERLHGQFDAGQEQAFIDAYAAAHAEAFGEEFQA